jgi:hypothetical protein
MTVTAATVPLACPIARAESHHAALLDVRKAAADLVNGVTLGLVTIMPTDRADPASLKDVLMRLHDALERSAG